MHLVLKKPDAVSLAVKTGALIFLPGDMIKCLILALIVPKLRLQRHPPGVA
jgi:biotin transporter BioY